MKNICRQIYFECLLHTFAARDNSKYNEPKSIQTFKNPQGWRTVASTEVFSELSFGLSRGDHPSFFYSQNLNVMRDNRDEATGLTPSERGIIRDCHRNNRQALILSLKRENSEQLINDFLTEMDAKNQAYSFIMDIGQLLAFRDYCINPKPQN